MTSLRTSSSVFAALVGVLLLAPNAQAQNSFRVTDKQIQLTSVSRNRICGQPLGANSKSKSDVCFPDSPPIAQTMGAAKDLAVTSATSWALDTKGKWTCWGLPTARLKAVIDKLMMNLAQGEVPFAVGDNLCTKTSTETSTYLSCTAYTTYPQGPLAAANGNAAGEKIQRFGPFHDVKAIGGSKSFLCVIDGTDLRCQSTGLFGLTFPPDITHPRLVAATSFSVCFIDDKGLRCAGDSPIEKLKPRAEWKDAKLLRGSEQGVCAVRASGRLECETDIGKNAEQFQIPKDLEPTADFGIGTMHMCALSVSGNVRCWGLDAYEGLLTVPKFNTRVVKLGVGDAHTCALLATGAVTCWGRPGEPQLQVPLSQSTDIRVATGREFSCSFGPSGVNCDGVTSGSGTVPQMPQVLSVVVPPSSGDTACAITKIPSPLNNANAAATAARCWGLSRDIEQIPESVVNPRLISMSTNYACAASEAGLTCWGHEEAVRTSYPDRIGQPRKLVTAQKHACVTDEYGLACWGELLTDDGLDLRVPGEYEGRNAVLDVAVGDRHTCVLTASREVRCWGDNSFGQLNVPNLDRPTSIGAVESMSCATDKKGVICWGEAFGLGEKVSPRNNASPGSNSNREPRLPFPGASSRYPYHIDP